MSRVRHRLSERGISCPRDGTNVLVTVNRVSSVLYNSEFENQYFYKTYEEQAEIVPLSLLIRRRDPSHHWNIEARCRQIEGDLRPNQKAICLNSNHFGVMANLEFVDHRKKLVKLSFDKTREESKVHDPFIAQKHIKEL